MSIVKNIFVASLLFIPLLVWANTDETKQQISDVELQIAKLNQTLRSLKSKLREESPTGEAMIFENQMEDSDINDEKSFVLTKNDMKSNELKKLFKESHGHDFFGLKSYNTNYFLPVSYSASKYRRINSGTHYNNYTPEQMDKYGYYEKNMEAEFQLSFKKPLSYDFFGFNESINFAYTQKVWWAVYSEKESAPFRESNYMPEFFVTVPTSDVVDDASGLKATKFGFIHESNGQDGYRSRSWNRLYLAGLWQWNNFFLTTRAWYRFSEDEKYEGYYDGAVNPDSGKHEPNDKGDDNPNIENYLGYGDLKLSYLYGDAQMNALLRYNFGSGGTNRGAVDFSCSYPFFNSKNTFWYVKFFNGYGESLIEYDQSVTKTSFGFSFSRTLF